MGYPSLPLELLEFACRVGNPFEAKAIDQVKRRGGPFVVLMLLVRPEDQLCDGPSVPGTTGLNVTCLIAEAIQEFLAYQACHSRQPTQ